MITKPKYPKRLSSGKYMDLANMQMEDVDIEDINTALNQIIRFGGHHKDRFPLTVAQHTVLVMLMSRKFFPDESDVEFHCLLHDFAESYYGDIVTPIKHRLKNSEIFTAFIDGVDDAVYAALWKDKYTLDTEVHDKMKICDAMALDIERRAMWDSQKGKNMWPDPPRTAFTLKDKIQIFEAISEQGNIDLVGIYNKF